MAEGKCSESKHCSKRLEENDKDRISSLPDEILSRILAFLPTKFAVGTSTLSTRWRYLWTFLLHIDIDDDDDLSCDCDSDKRRCVPGERDFVFVNFMNTFFERRSVRSVRKIHLGLHGTYGSSTINSWISAAIMGNVEELRLFRCDSCPAWLPDDHLFHCEKLVILVLEGNIKLNVPNCVCFPSLKILHVIDLPVLDTTSLCIEMVLSSCPVLEELIICMHGCNSMQLCSSSLKRLILELHSYGPTLDLHSYGPDPDENDQRRLTIKTPNLEFLQLADTWSEELNMLEASSLVQANIDVDTPICRLNRQIFYGDILAQFLRQISIVKILILSHYTLRALEDVADYLSRLGNLPTFSNLTRLEVDACNDQRWLLPEILKCSPNLEVFILEMISSSDINIVSHVDVADQSAYQSVEWCAPESVPQCLLLCLEVIEIKGFLGEPGEVEMVEYILKNAMVLRKMTITIGSGINDLAGFFVKKVLMFPRGSSACEIAFS